MPIQAIFEMVMSTFPGQPLLNYQSGSILQVSYAQHLKDFKNNTDNQAKLKDSTSRPKF